MLCSARPSADNVGRATGRVRHSGEVNRSSTARMDPINLYDYEERAKQVLPHNYWEYLEAGAMDELTTARNRSAFEALSLRPRLMRDVAERKISTSVLGTDISFSVMISPADGYANAHPEGERATARGAGMSNTLMMCSANSNNKHGRDCRSGHRTALVPACSPWLQLHGTPGQAR